MRYYRCPYCGKQNYICCNKNIYGEKYLLCKSCKRFFSKEEGKRKISKDGKVVKK